MHSDEFGRLATDNNPDNEDSIAFMSEGQVATMTYEDFMHYVRGRLDELSSIPAQITAIDNRLRAIELLNDIDPDVPPTQPTDPTDPDIPPPNEEEQDPNTSILINFGPSGFADSPIGYTLDTGAPGSGGFGWHKTGTATPIDNQRNFANRNTGDVLFGTMVRCNRRYVNGAWVNEAADFILDVADGVYTVRVGMGDAGVAGNRNTCKVNGVTVLDFTQTPTQKHAEGEIVVEIDTENMVFDFSDSIESAVCYIEVIPNAGGTPDEEPTENTYEPVDLTRPAAVLAAFPNEASRSYAIFGKATEMSRMGLHAAPYEPGFMIYVGTNPANFVNAERIGWGVWDTPYPGLTFAGHLASNAGPNGQEGTRVPGTSRSVDHATYMLRWDSDDDQASFDDWEEFVDELVAQLHPDTPIAISTGNEPNGRWFATSPMDATESAEFVRRTEFVTGGLVSKAAGESLNWVFGLGFSGSTNPLATGSFTKADHEAAIDDIIDSITNTNNYSSIGFHHYDGGHPNRPEGWWAYNGTYFGMHAMMLIASANSLYIHSHEWNIGGNQPNNEFSVRRDTRAYIRLIADFYDSCDGHSGPGYGLWSGYTYNPWPKVAVQALHQAVSKGFDIVAAPLALSEYRRRFAGIPNG